MTAAADPVNDWLEAFAAFERGLDDDAPARRLQALRHDALEHFRSVGLPSSRDEDWRHTSLAPIARLRFALPCPPPAACSTCTRPPCA